MQNFDIFCLSGPTIVRIWVKLKLVKFYKYFSRYNFEKLIRTLIPLNISANFPTIFFFFCSTRDNLQLIDNFSVFELGQFHCPFLDQTLISFICELGPFKEMGVPHWEGLAL